MTVTHGLSRTHPLYERWKGMRARCGNPAHPSWGRYGGRGIRVCRRWGDFEVFLADVEATWPGPGFDLHRVDNDDDYRPGNVSWISEAEHRAFPKSAEHRARIGDAHRGRTHLTPEQYAEIGRRKRAQLDPAWLREAYVTRGLSIYAIAAEARCGKSSVHRAAEARGDHTMTGSRTGIWISWRPRWSTC
jgi:hypothetical protein